MELVKFSPMVFFLFLFLICIPIQLVCLIDILRSAFKDSVLKLLWVIVVWFIPVFGLLFYFFIGRKQKN
jgi:hypothetical protein